MQDAGRLFVVSVTAVLVARCSRAVAECPDWLAVYKSSIAVAAVSETAHALRPIDENQAEVTVVHVQTHPTVKTDREILVSLPDELRPLCKGHEDRRLVLQMALGLKPEAEDLEAATPPAAFCAM